MIKKENKALFLDRDGVINEDIGYPYKAEHIVFRDGIFSLCKIARKKGYILVVVTNQAGVAKGIYTESDVKSLHVWMAEQFLSHEIEIAGFYYCPYHKNGTVPEYIQDSDCRKPRPGMILKASDDLGIDIKKSVIVGDKPSDRIQIEGLRSIIIKSKYSDPNYDASDLLEVENLI